MVQQILMILSAFGLCFCKPRADKRGDEIMSQFAQKGEPTVNDLDNDGYEDELTEENLRSIHFVEKSYDDDGSTNTTTGDGTSIGHEFDHLFALSRFQLLGPPAIAETLVDDAKKVKVALAYIATDLTLRDYTSHNSILSKCMHFGLDRISDVVLVVPGDDVLRAFLNEAETPVEVISAGEICTDSVGTITKYINNSTLSFLYASILNFVSYLKTLDIEPVKHEQGLSLWNFRFLTGKLKRGGVDFGDVRVPQHMPITRQDVAFDRPTGAFRSSYPFRRLELEDLPLRERTQATLGQKNLEIGANLGRAKAQMRSRYGFSDEVAEEILQQIRRPKKGGMPDRFEVNVNGTYLVTVRTKVSLTGELQIKLTKDFPAGNTPQFYRVTSTSDTPDPIVIPSKTEPLPTVACTFMHPKDIPRRSMEDFSLWAREHVVALNKAKGAKNLHEDISFSVRYTNGGKSVYLGVSYQRGPKHPHGLVNVMKLDI